MKSDEFTKMLFYFYIPLADMLMDPRNGGHQEIMIFGWAREQSASGIPYAASISRQRNDVPSDMGALHP
jgi:hypothetical protein